MCSNVSIFVHPHTCTNACLSLQVAKFAREHQKLFVFNLCGSYVCENHPKEMAELLPYVDILFGYVEEYKTLEKHLDLSALSSEHQRDGLSIVHSLPRIMAAVHHPNSAGTKAPKSYPISTTTTVVATNSKSSDGGRGVGSTVTALSDNSHYFDNSDVLNEDIDTQAPTTPTATTTVEDKLSPSTDYHDDDPPTAPLQQQELVVHNSSGISSSINCSTDGRPAHIGKVCIMTQGPDPLLYVANNGAICCKLIAPLEPSTVVDTTGAGDSFVGGFLACVSKGKQLEECVEGGVWAARQILQQKGCTIPTQPATFISHT